MLEANGALTGFKANEGLASTYPVFEGSEAQIHSNLYMHSNRAFSCSCGLVERADYDDKCLYFLHNSQSTGFNKSAQYCLNISSFLVKPMISYYSMNLFI